MKGESHEETITNITHVKLNNRNLSTDSQSRELSSNIKSARINN